MGYGDFVEISKAVYVEAATDDFALEDGARSSDSRVAILTGLTRKEVARQREVLHGQKPIRAGRASRASKVLSGWHNDRDFTGPFDIPMTLAFDGNGSTFTELVKRYSGDMPARAMLEELLRVGAVRKNEDGDLQVLTSAYIPAQISPEQVTRLGHLIHDLGASLEHNLNPDRTTHGYFERRVLSTEGISKSHLEEFNEHLHKYGQEFLVSLDTWLVEAERRSATDKSEKVKPGVEVFLFTTDEK